MVRSFKWARHEIFFSFKKGVSCVLIANKVKDFVSNQSFFLLLKKENYVYTHETFLFLMLLNFY